MDGQIIRPHSVVRRLKAYRLYQKTLRLREQGTGVASSPMVSESKIPLAPKVEIRLDSKEALRTWIEDWAGHGRKQQRRELLDVVDTLVSLGSPAQEHSEREARASLQRLGEYMPSLVLEGTLQQQFFCKLATRFGFRRAAVTNVVVDLVVLPMIDALRDVIRLGAETTRDSAIEGMGALLALAAKQKTPAERCPEEEPIRDGRGDPELNEMFKQRLERRRLMVLAVADPEWREKLLTELEEPIEPKLEAVRAEGAIKDVFRKLETVLYRHYDLLRVLPAIARQNEVTQDLPRFVKLLCDATKPLLPRAGDPDSILIAYARYRESVFRTIDNFIRRNVSRSSFDSVVASAVHAIPRTMSGVPKVCNAEIRATVSILRTAIRVVCCSGKWSRTREELVYMFRTLGHAKPWLNLGIAEACYRGLPDLLAYEAHNELSEMALRALLEQLAAPATDLAATHRTMIAISCFRRILVALEERGDERVGEDLRILLSEPTKERVIACFQPNGRYGRTDTGRSDIDVDVIAAIGHECQILRSAGTMLTRWEELSPEQNVLLTRILACLLHAVSRDAPEVARYPRLQRVFDGMSAVAMPHAEAMGKVWDLLAKLPPQVAEAADPDIQRFVEYRGRRRRAEGNVQESVEDLPGYVLAMISRETSDRIAGGIAREIDLNLRHDRDADPQSDFAEPLYEVMMRGPHESIFDHLMPRICAERDRKMVALFRNHVHVVRDGMDKPPRELVTYLCDHVKDLTTELTKLGGPTLDELAHALTLFGELVSEEDECVWTAIVEHRLADFFRVLDKLDMLMTHDSLLLEVLELPHEKLFKQMAQLDHAFPSDKRQRWRSLLTYRNAKHLANLQSHISHYVELPVSNFAARRKELDDACVAVRKIEHDLARQETLQPPKRILLRALMQHLRDIFERTRRWYCDEAEKMIDKNEKEGFWIVFALDREKRDQQLMKRIKATFASGAEVRRVALKQHETMVQIEKVTKTAGSEPPRFRGQTRLFEEFAVDWMTSDLDPEALWNALSDRWRKPYRIFFNVVTRPLLALGMMLLPFVWALGWHLVDVHTMEGLLFWGVGAVILVGAGWAVIRLILMVRRETADPPVKEEKQHEKRGYLFRSLLPQLAGFIAAPMALIAKFEHSYQFPFTASIWSMALLILLAFVTTRFYLEREVVDRSASSPEMTPRERQKVAKVLGVTLTQAFGIAVLLSAIFAHSHYLASHDTNAAHHERHYVYLEHDQKLHDFAGFVPHQAFLEWKVVFPFVRDQGDFTFYPTIILSWTALGLFFGLVLEGIDKGEHLRRRSSKEAHR
ncbi:MAG: hypothetical protein ACJ74H_10220 [Thermoanaerobaculia bacterium]